MSSVIQNLMDTVLQDGARSTKFDCILSFGTSGLFDTNNLGYHVKTSQFPGKSHDVIDFKFKGRTIPIKGQVKYENKWECTFYLTEDHKLKKAFEDWIEALDQRHNIKRFSDDASVTQAQTDFGKNGYSQNLKIVQLDFEGRNEMVMYELHNAFPTNVSTVEVDYSDVGVVLEYTVEFSYSFFDTVIEAKKQTNRVEKWKEEVMADMQKFVKEKKTELNNAIISGIDEIFGLNNGEQNNNKTAVQEQTVGSVSGMTAEQMGGFSENQSSNETILGVNLDNPLNGRGIGF